MHHSPRLGLPHIVSGQALKHITHNEALESLDVLVQPVVEASDLATPPSSPLVGEAWIVGEDASGAWAGHSIEIAAWQAGAWRFFEPATGWQVFDRAAGALRIFDGADWVAVASPGAGLPQLGVHTAADTTNRFALASDASLFTHDGAGHQLKINKAGSSETASILFQSHWSGRAEMGLMGDDVWRIKVSADGFAWTNALAIDPTDGAVTFAGPVSPALDNAQSLGTSGARWSEVWAANGTIETSDERLKADIAPADLGLGFILALEPVRYRWRAEAEAAGQNPLHYGLLAQQVAKVAAQLGVPEFGGHILVDPDDPDSQQALRYSSFIAPLISAIQEIAQRLEAVEQHAGTGSA